MNTTNGIDNKVIERLTSLGLTVQPTGNRWILVSLKPSYKRVG